MWYVLYVLTALCIYFAVKPLTWIVMYQKKNISKDDAERGGDPSPPEEESDEEEDDEDDDDMDLDRTAASQEHEEQERDGTSVLPGEDEQGVVERDRDLQLLKLHNYQLLHR